jgi:hypothetical protein
MIRLNRCFRVHLHFFFFVIFVVVLFVIVMIMFVIFVIITFVIFVIVITLHITSLCAVSDFENEVTGSPNQGFRSHNGNEAGGQTATSTVRD